MPTSGPIDPNTPLLESEPVGDGFRVPADKIETHRLRIVNRVDGVIQVSTNQGKNWQMIGRVLRPARTALEGYIAAQYAAPSSVAAVAVHGLRLCVGGKDRYLKAPFVIGIEPLEYTNRFAREGKAPNKGFGGYVAGKGGIFTDLPAGSALFRELSPLVGNPVLLESAGRLIPLPPTFTPRGEGETLIIPVLIPKNPLVSVVFENKAGGQVMAAFADGTKKEITRVVRPVLGTGRFDGTTYTGVGLLNTVHTGVITVGTAPTDFSRPEGQGKERRGGFQISPVWHNRRTEEAGTNVVMTIGSDPAGRKKELEGKPPLFRDYLCVDDGESAFVEVSIDGGDWEPMPQIVGYRQNVLKAAGLERLWREQGSSRTAKYGVTAFRLVLKPRTPQRVADAATAVVRSLFARRLTAARNGQLPLVSGTLTINANPTNRANVMFVRLAVNGTPKGMTNVAPFTLTWDTTRVPDGEYIVEAEALDSSGVILATTRRRVFVYNGEDSVTAP